MGQSTDEMSGGTESTHEIRRDIERTQREMSQTIDEIQYRLSPDYLKRRTTESIRRAGVRTSRGFMDKVKENPLGAAMVGVGLWMLFRDKDHDIEGAYYGASDQPWQDAGYTGARGYGYNANAEYRDFEYGADADRDSHTHGRIAHAAETARERVGGLADAAREKVGGFAGSARDASSNIAGRTSERVHSLTDSARYGMSRVRTGSRDFLTESPLVAGVAALAIGAVVGAMIPETEREHELFGETRDRLADRAKGLAAEGASHVADIASSAVSAAKEAARDEAKTAKSEMSQSLRSSKDELGV
jgi:hypothetical protein